MIMGAPVEQIASLRNGELLLSEYYLQSLLSPSVNFQGLQATVQTEGSVSHVDVVPRWDHEDHKHYLIEHTLSSTYRILHLGNCIFVSHSLESMEDATNDSICATPHFKTSTTLPFTIDTDEEEEAPTSFQDTQATSEYTKLDSSKDTSIIEWIVNRTKTCKLSKLIELCGPPNKVVELPAVYNGNTCFELPPAHDNGSMHGMEQKYNGHLWSRPASTNMAIECTVRLSYCLGSLHYYRFTCPFYMTEGRYNDAFFHGHLDKQVSMGYPAVKVNLEYLVIIVIKLSLVSMFAHA